MDNKTTNSFKLPPKQKSSNNSKTNSLSEQEIRETVKRITNYLYKPGKSVRANHNRMDYEVPRLLIVDGFVLANPFAFNSSRKFMHPHYGFRPTVSIPGKGESYARLGLHNILWRWYNHYDKIPDNKTVSHVCDNGYNVSPYDLVIETQEVNAARKACREQKWYKDYLDDKGKYVRCPHVPICRERAKIPSKEVFVKRNQKPLTYEKLKRVRKKYHQNKKRTQSREFYVSDDEK